MSRGPRLLTPGPVKQDILIDYSLLFQTQVSRMKKSIQQTYTLPVPHLLTIKQ